jgi:carbonic anhydrase
VIEKLLDGNRRFVESEFDVHLDYYRALAQAQRPAVLWIGCSDSRVCEHVITSSKPGTLFVHRNIANLVSFNDVNVAAIIEYALLHLKIEEIVVCGHYGCGGIRALEDGVSESYIADWLLIAGDAKDRVDRIARERGLSKEAKLDLLSEENVRLQIDHLRRFSVVRNMHARGAVPRIHGLMYAVKTGRLDVLVDGSKP